MSYTVDGLMEVARQYAHAYFNRYTNENTRDDAGEPLRREDLRAYAAALASQPQAVEVPALPDLPPNIIGFRHMAWPLTSLYTADQMREYGAACAVAGGAQFAAKVPEGWKLVPIELTKQMIEAAFDAQPEAGAVSLAAAWDAMLAAAPSLQAAQPAGASQGEPSPKEPT
jgi:hypothetical protein